MKRFRKTTSILSLFITFVSSGVYSQIQDPVVLKQNGVSGIVSYTYLFDGSGRLSEEHFDVDSNGRILGTYFIDDSTHEKQYTYTLEYETEKGYARERHFWRDGEPIYELTTMTYSDSIVLFFLIKDSISREVHILPSKSHKWTKVISNHQLIRKYKYVGKKKIEISFNPRSKSKTIFSKDDMERITRIDFTLKARCKTYQTSKEEVEYDSNGLYIERRNFVNDSIYSSTFYEYQFR